MRSPNGNRNAWPFGFTGLLVAFLCGSLVMLAFDSLLRSSGPASLSEAELSLAVLKQKLKMHEDEGDRLRADISTYESRVAELEKHLAQSMASTEASLALATSNIQDACDEEAVQKLQELGGAVVVTPSHKEHPELASPARFGSSSAEVASSSTPPSPRLLPRGAGLFERAHDGSIITAVLDGSGSGGAPVGPEEADQEKRAKVREAIEARRRTTVVDKGKREYDALGDFVGYNAKKKVQLPRNYFIDYNETSDSFDVREDGTYKGYGTPERKAWLNKHTKRILHDFQWVYENNRVHQKQRFMGVRIGQDPFDALVIQEMLYDVKPDLIIETGTNSGGGALYMSVMMEAINPECKIFTIDTVPISDWMKKFKNSATGGVKTNTQLRQAPDKSSRSSERRRHLLGSTERSRGEGGGEEEDEAAEDIAGLVDPRAHPMWKKRVTQVVGKSTDRRILRQLKYDFVAKAKKVLVVLDSDHSSGTVLSELINYAPFVSLGSYIVVEDTWQRHPLFAAEKFLENYGNEFIQDRSREHLMWSQHKGGWLKRVKLPARTKAGDLDYEYQVNVQVSGGRIKTYGKVDIDGPDDTEAPPPTNLS